MTAIIGPRASMPGTSQPSLGMLIPDASRGRTAQACSQTALPGLRARARGRCVLKARRDRDVDCPPRGTDSHVAAGAELPQAADTRTEGSEHHQCNTPRHTLVRTRRGLMLQLGAATALCQPLGLTCPPAAEANILAGLLGPRRDVLAGVAPTAEIQPLGAQLLVAQLRGEERFSSWARPWSGNAAALDVKPAGLRGAGEDDWPAWLAREWRVEATFKDVSFPMGRKFVSQTLPGFRMASILLLPNIGQEASYTARLPLSDETIGPNAKSVLEAFWPAATVVSQEASANGELTLTYKGPTLREKSAQQSVRLTPVATEGWSIDSRHFVSSQVFVQNNLEQNLRGLFQVVTLYENQQEAGLSSEDVKSSRPSVKAQQRVAAFVLDDSEPMYFDAGGLEVATYDYNLSMEMSF